MLIVVTLLISITRNGGPRRSVYRRNDQHTFTTQLLPSDLEVKTEYKILNIKVSNEKKEDSVTVINYYLKGDLFVLYNRWSTERVPTLI